MNNLSRRSLFAGIALFVVMSLWVIVAGFGDIRHMFAELRKQRECNESDDLP